MIRVLCGFVLPIVSADQLFCCDGRKGVNQCQLQRCVFHNGPLYSKKCSFQHPPSELLVTTNLHCILIGYRVERLSVLLCQFLEPFSATICFLCCIQLPCSLKLINGGSKQCCGVMITVAIIQGDNPQFSAAYKKEQ